MLNILGEKQVCTSAASVYSTQITFPCFVKGKLTDVAYIFKLGWCRQRSTVLENSQFLAYVFINLSWWMHSRETDSSEALLTLCLWFPLLCSHVSTNIYIYIYIYIVLFGPVTPELGLIPLGQKNHATVNI